MKLFIVMWDNARDFCDSPATDPVAMFSSASSAEAFCVRANRELGELIEQAKTDAAAGRVTLQKRIIASDPVERDSWSPDQRYYVYSEPLRVNPT